jgi:hypothetical protein
MNISIGGNLKLLKTADPLKIVIRAQSLTFPCASMPRAEKCKELSRKKFPPLASIEKLKKYTVVGGFIYLLFRADEIGNCAGERIRTSTVKWSRFPLYPQPQKDLL